MLLTVLPALPVVGQEATERSTPPAVATDEIVRQLQEIIKELRALRADVRSLRTPPAPPAPARVSLGDAPVLGKPEARLGIVEFADFQCPYCKRFHNDTFSRIKTTFIDSGKARYWFRNFPLEGVHPEARQAALVAVCAWRKDLFWPVYSALFDHQTELAADAYREIARSVGLDSAALLECIGSPEASSRLKEDVTVAERAGVAGTPHFLLGRVEGDQLTNIAVLSGAQPFDAFAAALERLAPNQ
ncbi:MAG TPA: thioredoxin domain-containing protein [Vicinamibacteria bacterium]|nr:thioredoxin domain-containing protein [Vicinamibacteria bacterium]